MGLFFHLVTVDPVLNLFSHVPQALGLTHPQYDWKKVVHPLHGTTYDWSTCSGQGLHLQKAQSEAIKSESSSLGGKTASYHQQQHS